MTRFQLSLVRRFRFAAPSVEKGIANVQPTIGLDLQKVAEDALGDRTNAIATPMIRQAIEAYFNVKQPNTG